MFSVALVLIAIINLDSRDSSGVENPASDDFLGKRDDKDQDQASHAKGRWQD